MLSALWSEHTECIRVWCVAWEEHGGGVQENKTPTYLLFATDYTYVLLKHFYDLLNLPTY
jgi:hypothetical protein